MERPSPQGGGQQATQSPRSDGRSVAPHDQSTTSAWYASDSELLHSLGDQPESGLRPDALPGYEIVREIHRGGQGVVYQALQKSTKRQVAIKFMREGAFATPADRARFEREVEILARLNHPNVVTIHDSGAAAGHVYFVMDYIAGEPFDAWVAGGRPPEPARPRPGRDELLLVFTLICDAVHAAHQRGIVHRDLKPSNIRMAADGQPHVLDFGLAKISGMQPGDTPPTPALTMTGQFMGSLPWASPEQAEAQPERIGVGSDVYSLGVMLYHVLAGRFPYDVTGNIREVLNRIATVEPAPLAATPRDIPADLQTIVLKCLRKEPDRRYAHAGELAQDLRHFLAGEPIAARRDSLLYLVRKRTTFALRHHPLVTAALAIVGVTILAQTVLGPALTAAATKYAVNGGRTFHKFAAERLLRGFHHTRVVSLSDRTNLAAVATASGVAADCWTSDKQCLRTAHGYAMGRLATARPAVVVWALAFTGDSDFDPAFVAGVEALRAANCPVLIGTRTWDPTDEATRALSPAIVKATAVGCTTAGLSPAAPWSIYVGVQHGDAEPVRSLALLTYSAFRRPFASAHVELDEAAQTLRLYYEQPAERIPGRSALPPPTDTLALFSAYRLDAPEPDVGLAAGDLVGALFFALPADADLQAATCDYGRLFTADDAELRKRFQNKVVIFGDERARHFYETPDGRTLWAVYAHATAVELLLQGASLHSPTAAVTWGLTALAAAIGWPAGRKLHRRGRYRLGLVAATLPLWPAAVLAGLFVWTVAYNPVAAALAFVVTLELAARHRRLAPATEPPGAA